MVGSLKWPNELSLIRHGQSVYNIGKETRREHPVYQEFLRLFKVWQLNIHQDPSPKLVHMAGEVTRFFPTVYSDADTPLTDQGRRQARQTAEALHGQRVLHIPDVIYVSPYLRTVDTFKEMCRGWMQLSNCEIFYDERIRELDHGLSTLYGDWRVFHVLHPEQARLRELAGECWYRFPNGQNVPDVVLSVRNWRDTLVREHAGKRVMVICHHITLLAFRTDQERLGPAGYVDLNTHSKPINCGVTIYRSVPVDPEPPENSPKFKLVLEKYNEKYYRVISTKKQ